MRDHDVEWLTHMCTLELRERRMEKYGVEKDTEKVKQAGDGQRPGTCPWCGKDLDENGHCPVHGSEPFEKPRK